MIDRWYDFQFEPQRDAAGCSLASLLETCKLNGVAPQSWLTDVLHRMATGHPASQLDELLPWQWKANQPPKN
ncbi:MAG: transposase domain-containing protein [Beijerinckiaceae bacterium]|nr:transposase domain-containing protein [Beijerinckiaceae bacterium]